LFGEKTVGNATEDPLPITIVLLTEIEHPASLNDVRVTLYIPSIV
jgi:hypothetical protein